MALARKYRLEKKDIRRVLKVGKTVRNSFFFIKFLENNSGHLKVSVIIPVRVSKKSTVRNSLERIITEALREDELKAPFNIVITATPTIVGKLGEEIKRDLKRTINNFYVNKTHN